MRLQLIALALLFCACNAPTQAPNPPSSEALHEAQTTAVITLKTEPVETESPLQVPLAGLRLGLTYGQLDGNPLLGGSGTLPRGRLVDYDLGGTPIWLVAAPFGKEIIWVAVLENGAVHALRNSAGALSPIALEPPRLPPGMPPLLVIDATGPHLLVPPKDASPFTTALPLTDDGLAYIDDEGDLVLRSGESETARFPLDALPDARILSDENERLLLLTNATAERYTHGVLGDRLEAAAITLIETRPEPRIVTRIEVPAPQVIEGIAPIWTDVDRDGEREILVTVSDGAEGARLAVYAESGERLYLGPSIGQGQRWRHQLAVAPFGGDNRAIIASIITPHIGGMIEFFEPVENRLRFLGSEAGYSSHAIGSRNLDMGLAGDLDGDGRSELLVPNQRRNELGAAHLTADGVNIAWTLPLGGQLTTNLAGAETARGIAIGAGRSDGILRLWLPVEE